MYYNNTIELERSLSLNFLSSADFFFVKITFFNKFFQEHTIKVSILLDQDQDRHSSRSRSGSLLFAKVISR